MAATPNYRSRFGDTTFTKVFVGGLAWETSSAELHRYFEQFGEILEAVVITDKNTGRSKGYGFVTFREPESARRACEEPNPIIDGRRANCNIAALGPPRPSHPRGNPHQQRGPQPAGSPYSMMPSQMAPPTSVIYPHNPYGYVTYTADYGYPQAVYNPQMPSQYHPSIYGSPTMGPAYPYSPISYTMQGPPRANFPMGSQGPRMQGPSTPPPPPPYIPYSPAQGVIPSSSHPYGFQLQAPPTRKTQPASDSETPQQPQPTKLEPNREGNPEA